MNNKNDIIKNCIEEILVKQLNVFEMKKTKYY